MRKFLCAALFVKHAPAHEKKIFGGEDIGLPRRKIFSARKNALPEERNSHLTLTLRRFA